MKRVLLTGMSATGKSTVIGELTARGFKAVDTDDGDWHEWARLDGGWDRVWREERIRQLLTTAAADLLFVSGTVPNQRKFFPLFDEVILLTAPVSVIIERLATRTNNPFGKQPRELAKILADIEAYEPRLRRDATFELNTDAPLEDVVATILRRVQA